jgi:threonine dehydrogenase-like Zn-dependent dehydrogenase
VTSTAAAGRSARAGASPAGRVVIIGPGKIGCGYLAPLFLSAGWHTVLVARTPERAERIRRCGGFRVRRAPGGESDVPSGTAIAFGGMEFCRAVSDADLILTAVGVENVASLGAGLALALGGRPRTSPVDVCVVENADVAPVLELAVRRAAAGAALALPPVGFAGAIAYRSSPVGTGTERRRRRSSATAATDCSSTRRAYSSRSPTSPGYARR